MAINEMNHPSTPLAAPIGVDIGIMARNEDRNISRLLRELASLESEKVRVESITVVSASDDGTDAMVENARSRDARIRLIKEPERKGKAHAINLFLKSVSSPVAMLVGADTLPAPGAVELLALPFLDPAVGMTGARPVPVNRVRSFPDFSAHFLWQAHHLLALSSPKCGEMVAFRPLFDSIPADTIVDEPELMSMVASRGLKILYVPEAAVYNWGPGTVREFVMRRRSITAGYFQQTARGHVMHRVPMGVKLAMGLGLILWVLARKRPVELVWAPMAVAVEFWARALGRWDFFRSRRLGAAVGLHVWQLAPTTKRGDWDSRDD